MARQQPLRTLANKTVAASVTPEAITASQLLACSVVIQALPSNTDIVYIGDSTRQQYGLSPGKAVEINGDALDHGTSSLIDIASIYCRVLVNGEGVSIMYLEGY